MYCSKCGQELNDSMRFCSRCGAPMENQPSAPSSTSTILPMGELLMAKTDTNLAIKIRKGIYLPMYSLIFGLAFLIFGIPMSNETGGYASNWKTGETYKTANLSGIGIFLLFIGIALLITCAITFYPIMIGVIGKSRELFKHSYLRMANGKLSGCGSSVADKFILKNFEIDYNDIIAVQCQKKELPLKFIKIFQVDEITVYTKNGNYMVWGLLNAPEVTININRILHLS